MKKARGGLYCISLHVLFYLGKFKLDGAGLNIYG